MIEQWMRWRLAQAGVTIVGPLGAMAAIVIGMSEQYRARLRPEPLTWVDSGIYASRCVLRLVALDVARVHGVWRVDAENHDGRALYECSGFESKEEAQRHAIAWALQAHDDETARCLASLIDLDAIVTR